MKNWKTTLCGAILAVGTYLSTQQEGMLQLVGQAIIVITPLIFGFVAKDHDVTGGKKPQ